MMNLRRITIFTVVLCAAAAATFAFAGQDHHHHSKLKDDFSAGMHKGMEVMMRDMDAAPMTGNPDVDFLAMMIPHHEGAVEMARLVLLYGRDPLVRRLAEEIIAGQTTEIEAMKKRLEILRARPDPNPGGFPALGGTRGPADAGKKSGREAR